MSEATGDERDDVPLIPFVDPRAAWTEKAQWMREVGAVHAVWSDKDDLLTLTLGPPPMPAPVPQEKEKPNPRLVEADRRRIALGAGAQLIKRET